jgi:hypothetical protein
MASFNHRRFYQKPEQRKIITKMEITNGMIITFRYKGGTDKRPLLFVMDTDEYIPREKRDFSGINLNYLTIGEINTLFLKILNQTGWEYDLITKMPKVDIWDEENPGPRPIKIYESVIKKQVLNKRDCWRTYKYSKVNIVEQINFKFTVPPLNKILTGHHTGKINKKTLNKQLTKTRYGKISGDIKNED